MNSAPYTLRFFLSVLLILVCLANSNAQQQPTDTLRNVSADTVSASETLEEQVKYFASDSAVAWPEDNKAIFYGDGSWVQYGEMKLKAAVMEVDYNTNIVKAYGATDTLGNRFGNPVFTEGTETMEADTIKYNLKTKKGKIYNALTRQGELLVVGNEIKKDSNDVIYMRNMKCIPCNEVDAKTVFRATRAKIIPNDKIVTGPMYVEVAGVPTPLGLPFGYFPNTKKQHNGILLPTYGYIPGQGFVLRNGGLYLGFNDKTDMELRGSIYGNGGFMLSSRNRYYVLYKYQGYTFLSFTRINTGEREIPRDRPGAFNRNNAVEIRWQHVQDNKSNPSVRFSSDMNVRFNQDFNRFNAVNSAQYLSNTFQSNVGYTKTWRFGNLSINGLHRQNSISRSMELSLPVLTFNVNRFYPFRREGVARQNVFDKIQMHYMMQASNVLSGHEDSIFVGDLSEKFRNGIKHTLPIQTNFNLFRYITVTPMINLSSVMYSSSIRRDFQVNESGQAVQIIRTVKKPAIGYEGSFSTALNTQVYFDYVFMRGRVKQIRHLLIPTISYNYRPDFASKQFGFYQEVQRDTLGRMSAYSIFERGIFGGPQLGKVSSISVNLNNNIEAKIKQRTDTGMSFVKKALFQNLSMNGSYNFALDSFRMSDLGLNMRTMIFKHISVYLNSQFSPYVYDREAEREIDKYLLGSGRPARFVTGDITVNTRVGNDMLEAMRKLFQPTDLSNSAEMGGQVRTDDPPERLPWTLTLGYNLRLTNYDDRRIQPTHALDVSADMMPTKFWKVGVSTGFDFTSLKARQTRVTIYRNLKCWEAHIMWVPFGLGRTYMIGINMKTSMLRDVKIERQRPPWSGGF